MHPMMENKTFDEIVIGDTASLPKVLRREDLDAWAAVTGNINLEEMFADGSGLAMWAATLFSTIIGTKLPGLGSVTQEATIRFQKPVRGETHVVASVTVRDKRAETGVVVLDCRCVDASGDVIVSAVAEVRAPKTKIRKPRPDLPEFALRHEGRLEALVERCSSLPPLKMAVVHPCSDDALVGAIDAAEAKLIDLTLVGPEARIRAVAAETGVDLSPYRLVPTEHSHHSAEVAVALARGGEVQALMKGSLHTDELLHEVLRKEVGLRTDRLLSHCFLISAPTYARAILVTDAAINIQPSLEEKRDICQNAIELAHALDIAAPKVAILAAVETVTSKMPSTIDAAALCKMADRQQIVGGLLDGPLGFDNAVDEEAAKSKGIESAVAGRADILLVPNLEAGNMVAKQLTFMANGESAGLVVGARVPIVLTSRADGPRSRLASCALAVLLVEAVAQGKVLRKPTAG
jgi:phosphate acetyltransferase